MQRFRIMAAAVTMLVAVTIAVPGFADWETAWNAFQQGDCTTAVSEAGKVTESHPGYAPAYHLLGECQLRLQRQKEAVASLRRAVELEPDNQRYRLALAQGLVRLKRPVEAYGLLREVDLASVDEQGRTHVVLLTAHAALAAGETDAAVAMLEARTGQDPSTAGLYRALGTAYFKQGTSDEQSFAAYQRAFELDPADEVSGRQAVTLARRLAHNGAAEETRRQYALLAAEIAELLARANSNHEHLLLAGKAAFEHGGFAAALAWLDKARTKSPDHAETRYYLGRTLVALDRVEEGIEQLTATLTSKPDADTARLAHLHLGKMQACRLELEEAADHYRQGGNDKRAAEITEVAASSQEALARLKKLRSDKRELQGLEASLQKLDDQDGVASIREKVDEVEAAISKIEQNLAAVRSALCQ